MQSVLPDASPPQSWDDRRSIQCRGRPAAPGRCHRWGGRPWLGLSLYSCPCVICHSGRVLWDICSESQCFTPPLRVDWVRWAPSHSRPRCRVLDWSTADSRQPITGRDTDSVYSVKLVSHPLIGPHHTWRRKLVYFPEVSTWLTAMISLMFILEAHAEDISDWDSFPGICRNLETPVPHCSRWLHSNPTIDSIRGRSCVSSGHVLITNWKNSATFPAFVRTPSK